MSARALALLVTCGSLLGCGDPTELMLIVKAAPGLSFGGGGDIDGLLVSVQRANGDPLIFSYTRAIALCSPLDIGNPDCRPQRYAEPDYDKSLTLPVRLLLQPGDIDKSEPIRIHVDAQLGAKVRIANGLKFEFSPGRRLWLELPLYRECLGVVKCEQQDQSCGIDRDCTSLQPTTEPPPDVDRVPNDLAGIMSPPDAAQACGALGMACCQGQVCAASLMCNASGYCIDPSVSCGQEGQSCCASATTCQGTLLCVNQNCQTACGDSGHDCCGAPTECNKGTDKCISGKCQQCGQVGQACCPGGSCVAVESLCDQSDNTCTACGVPPARCCAGDVCYTGTCGTGSTDAGSSPPKDFSFNSDLGPDFSVPLGDGGPSTILDGGAMMGLSTDPGGLHPLGSGIPNGPPGYCL